MYVFLVWREHDRVGHGRRCDITRELCYVAESRQAANLALDDLKLKHPVTDFNGYVVEPVRCVTTGDFVSEEYDEF